MLKLERGYLYCDKGECWFSEKLTELIEKSIKKIKTNTFKQKYFKRKRNGYYCPNCCDVLLWSDRKKIYECPTCSIELKGAFGHFLRDYHSHL